MKYLVPRLAEILVVFPIALGCGRVTTPTDSDVGGPFGAGQRSGTRLKLEYVEFEGARQAFGIRDSARNEYCSFAQWSDGNSYCTPLGARQIVFSDASCSTKIGAGSSDACFPSKYFADYTVDRGGVTTYSQLYRVGEKLSLDRYFRMNNGVCAEMPAGGAVFYAVGPEVGVADLAPGSIGPPEGTGRIKARFATSPDGLRIAVSPEFDSVLGIDCTLRSDGTCWPSSVTQAIYYKDATCTAPAAQIDSLSPKKLIRESDCTFRAVGAQIQTTSAYFDATGVCTQVPLAPNHSLFDIGAKVTLATLGRKAVDSGPRIRPFRFAELDIADGVHMYDTDKQVECSPGTAADGSVYCFPGGGSLSTRYFTDSGCSIPVEIVPVPASASSCQSTEVPPFAIKSTFSPQSCTWTSESRPVGSRHTGQLYDQSTGRCAPASPLDVYYDVGPAVPLSELAKGAFPTDPM